MRRARYLASACVLPSGRFAVFGGKDHDPDPEDIPQMYRRIDDWAVYADAEAYDSTERKWVPLAPMSCPKGSDMRASAETAPLPRFAGSCVAIPGGALIASGDTPYVSLHTPPCSLLYDEEEDRYFTLPDRYYNGDSAERATKEEDQERRYEPELHRGAGCSLLAVPAQAAKLVARNA